MSRFSIEETPLAGLRCVVRQFRGDGRGFLSRLFCAEEFAPFFGDRRIEQINVTFTGEVGVVRGLHFQYPPQSEMKLVCCLRGEVWDVAVDLRAGSPTFLRWHAERLSGENGRCLLIPEGFAHGFQTLSADVELLYLHTAAYAPDAEGGLNPLDARLGISWPLAISNLSDRDRSHALLDETFTGIEF